MPTYFHLWVPVGEEVLKLCLDFNKFIFDLFNPLKKIFWGWTEKLKIIPFEFACFFKIKILTFFLYFK